MSEAPQPETGGQQLEEQVRLLQEQVAALQARVDQLEADLLSPTFMRHLTEVVRDAVHRALAGAPDDPDLPA